MKDNRIVAMWYNLSRVYEIAKVGGFSISIKFSPDYVEGFDDYKSIKSFYNDVEFKSNGDLYVEIYKPDYNTKPKETLESLHKNIDSVKNYKLPTTFNPVCDTLLSTAINRMDLSLIDTNLIRLVAQNIAKLDKKDIVRIEHMAEAIQYVGCKNAIDSTLINAESNSIQFGKHITIGLVKKDNQDIENAIKYLQSLL